jgi:serine/threonine protein kinase
MDYLPGGDLRELFSGYRSPFTEQQTKFTLVCILFGLEYLHNKNIIHRDIKPENLVLDDLGYIRVTDLGIARVYRNNNYHDTSGTPGYMAPEVLCLQNHTYAVDFFAVGVIGFEMMFKKRPYYGRNRK